MKLPLPLTLDVLKINYIKFRDIQDFSLINKYTFNLYECNVNYIIFYNLTRKNDDLKFNKNFNYLEASFLFDKKYINWMVIPSYNNKVSEDFIREFQDRLNWGNICKFHT